MTAPRIVDLHSELAGLSDDDHAQYLLLAGRAGGQTAYGGTAIGDDLDLHPNTQSPPVDFATDGFVNLHGRILFLGFTDLTAVPGINYQLMRHNEVVDCSGQSQVIPQGFWYTPEFQYDTAQAFGGSATFQDSSIWKESSVISGTHTTFSLGSFLGGPRYQIGHAGAGKPPSGLYAYNATPAADLMGGSGLTMPVMAGCVTNFPFPLQAFLALEPLRNGVVCTRYSHFKAYSAITHALTLHGGSTITTEVGLDLQNLARGGTAISIFSDALGAYMDHAGLITYTGGVLRLGTAAVSGHGLGAGDVILGADLEVDGVTWLDGPAAINPPNTTPIGLNLILASTTGQQLGARFENTIGSASVTTTPSAALLGELDVDGIAAITTNIDAINAIVALGNNHQTGTLSKVSAFRARIFGFNFGTSYQITEASGIRIEANQFLTGITVPTLAGLWIENLDLTGVTNAYPIYQVGPAGTNYFGSSTTIGDTKGLNTGLANDDYYTLGAVDNDTNTITEVVRVTGASQPSIDLKLARFGTSVLTADAAHRGMLYFVEGGTGVADKLYIIMKSTADTYSAVQVAIG